MEDVADVDVALTEWDVKAMLLQAVIPLGFHAACVLLEDEVTALTGPRYARHDGAPQRVRWGRQRGSIYLADQKLALRVPRVRDRHANAEVPLQTYARLQEPRAADEGVMRRILYGLSCRDYRACAEAVPAAFALSRSSLSRRYIKATARTLQALQERRLDGYDIVALVLDGKTCAEDAMVTALGLTTQGDKIFLGFTQTSTENATTCADLVRGLVARGLRYAEGLLVIVDGSKGLRAAVAEVFVRRRPSSDANNTRVRTWWRTCRRATTTCGAGNSRSRTRSRRMKRPGPPSTSSGRSSGSSTSPRCGASTKDWRRR